MKKLFVPGAPSLTREKDLRTLVENRSVYKLQHCEMNIFETSQKSEQVQLTFNSLVFTAMFRGKKVMHLKGMQAFDYLPGESVIVPENETMVIDFPEADTSHPTQCMALAIEKQKIQETLQILNSQYTRAEDKDEWKIDASQLHLVNSKELTTVIDRLVTVSKEDNKAKDIFANFMLQELLIRLMQTQARTLLLGNYANLANSHRFAYVINYIKQHLHEPVTIAQLAAKACMSKPTFFRSFKRELGMSPVEFIMAERISLAKKLLADTSQSISDVVYRSGFNNPSYFSQLFKKYERLSPREYKEILAAKSK